MATTAKSTSTNSTRTSKPKQTTPKQTATTASRSDSSQVREGVTKARKGAVAIVRESAERVVDLPVGAALMLRDRVEDAIEPWTTDSARERELKSLRTQVTRELNRFERRGGQARRKATQRARSTRNRVEREVKSRRREVEKTVRQNRGKAETQLKKARTTVQERIPVRP